MEVKAGRI